MFYGLDVHKNFIQICRIDEQGKERCDFKIDASHDAIASFAQSLTEKDAAVLEATFHSWAIWSLLRGHGARVVVANSMQVKAIAHARIKTDKVDAHILAQLLRADFIPEVTMPEEKIWALRQLVTHRQLPQRDLRHREPQAAESSGQRTVRSRRTQVAVGTSVHAAGARHPRQHPRSFGCHP